MIRCCLLVAFWNEQIVLENHLLTCRILLAPIIMPPAESSLFTTVYKHFKKIVSDLGMPDVRFHDLRHTYAMPSLQNGDDIKTVQQNVGHATASFTLDVYGHVSDHMQKESAKRMQSFCNTLSEAK